MQTGIYRLAKRATLAAIIIAATCSAQQQNVGVVGHGVSISFQNAAGSTERGVSIGFHDAAGTITVTTAVAGATFTVKGPATYTAGGLSFSTSNAPAGIYTITYGVVPGYTTPGSETKSLAPGASVSFTGSYIPLPGFGSIQVTTNVDSASYTVEAVPVNSGFVPFTRTGKFYDTGITVPVGTYRVTFSPVLGYFTPSIQILTLGAGSTLRFAGIYRRTIAVLFTGFKTHPSTNGVIYDDDDCPSGNDLLGYPNCAGMISLAARLRKDAQLKEGIHARTFTYYSLIDYGHSSEPWNSPPVDSSTHAVADNWVRNELQATADDQIIIIGHSYGGNRARLFANQLPSIGVSASLLVTIDPVNWDSVVTSSGILPGCTGIFPDGLFGACTQEGDGYAQVKGPSVADVLSFVQTTSSNLRGYHFVDFTPTFVPRFGGCGSSELFCSHIMISYDWPESPVFGSILSRARALSRSPGQSIFDISLAQINTNSATVTWRTLPATYSRIIYSQNVDAATAGIEVSDKLGFGIDHSASLSGLVANTRYYFRIRAIIPGSPSLEQSSVGFFQTSPIAPIIRASGATLTRDADRVSLAVTLTNSGAPATNGTLSAASIGASRAISVLPQPTPDLSTGTSANIVVAFAANVAAPGSTVAPIITLKYSGATFTVPVPPLKVP